MKFIKKKAMTQKEFVNGGNHLDDYDDYMEQHLKQQELEEEQFWEWWHSLSIEEQEHYENTHPTSVGKRLKELRKNQKITQEQMAKNLGVTKQTISNYETGNSTPPNNILDRLAVLYNAPINYILGTDIPQQNSAVANAIINEMDYIESITPSHYRDLAEFHNMKFPPSEQTWLLDILETFAKDLTTEQLYALVQETGLKALFNKRNNL